MEKEKKSTVTTREGGEGGVVKPYNAPIMIEGNRNVLNTNGFSQSFSADLLWAFSNSSFIVVALLSVDRKTPGASVDILARSPASPSDFSVAR